MKKPASVATKAGIYLKAPGLVATATGLFLDFDLYLYSCHLIKLPGRRQKSIDPAQAPSQRRQQQRYHAHPYPALGVLVRKRIGHAALG